MSTTAILISILIALATTFYLLLRRRLQYWQRLGIKCDEPSLFWGSMAGIRTKIGFVDVWMATYEKYKGSGPFVGFYWFQNPAAFVLEPFLAKEILIKNFNKFTDHGFYSNEKDDPLSGQLFLLDGHKWRNLRNKLSPVFTSGKMKFMFPSITKISVHFVDVLNKMVAKDREIEVKDILARFTTDVIGTCAFGLECNSLNDPHAEFRVMGRRSITEQRHGLLGIAIMSTFPEFARKLRMKQTPEFVEEFYMRIIRETVAYREKHNVRYNDFLDQLIDLKNNKMIKTTEGENTNLTLEQIAAQAFVFFTAGFETSSTTMAFALYELAQHPEIQQRVRDEVNAVLEENNGELTYEAMRQMVYMDQVIAETLRLYTVLPVLSRYCLEDFVVPGHPKYVIKKGMHVLIPSGAMHRDSALYPNPLVFNPDNFTQERVQKRDSIEWLPFGDGPRNCIGMRFGQMQVRIGLASLIKNFKFSVCDRTTIPIKYNKESFLLNSDGGIYLNVEQV